MLQLAQPVWEHLTYYDEVETYEKKENEKVNWKLSRKV
jgi:hypothetical protein